MLRSIMMLLTLFLCGAGKVNALNHIKACGDVIPCGRYEGDGQIFDQNRHPFPGTDFEERLELKAIDDLHVRWVHSLWLAGRPEQIFYALELTMEFGTDGKFDLRDEAGTLIGTGLCRQARLCTLSFAPFEWQHPPQTGVSGDVCILRFENNRLRRDMMSSVQAGLLSFQASSLTRR